MRPPPQPPLPALLLAIAALFAAPATTVAQASEPVPEGRPQPARLALEAVDTRTGDLVTPRLEDLGLLEDGRPRPILALGPAGGVTAEGGWRFVIYLDHVLATPTSMRAAAAALAQRAAQLTALGTVEVVTANPEPRLVLPATRDPLLLESTLATVLLSDRGPLDLRQLRRDFRRQARAPEGPAFPQAAALVARAVEEETRLVRRQQDALLAWLARDPVTPPAEERRALLLVGDGFDLDPRAFYLAELAAAGRDGVDEPADPGLAEATAELGQALSIYGWTTLLLAPDTPDVEVSAFEDFDRWRRETRTREEGRPRQDVVTVTVPLSKILDRLKGEGAKREERPLLLAPAEPLIELAAATGGSVLTDTALISGTLERLGRRPLLTYETAPEPDDDARPPRRLEVTTAAPDLAVRARRWASDVTPEIVAGARARRALEGETGGEMEVTATVRRAGETGEDATLELRADLRGEGGAGEGTGPPAPGGLRLTVAQATGGTLRLEHRRLAPAAPEDAALWSRSLPLRLAADARRVAVLVEDLATGRWGVTLAALGGVADTGAAGFRSPALRRRGDALPAPKALDLIVPAGSVVTGRITLGADVSRPGAVGRVDFFIDDRLVETVERPPFTTRVDLGRLPRTRTVRAVAYGTDGSLLGEDSAVLNEGGEAFRARIVSPNATNLRPGPVDVEVAVRVPAGERLDRLELYWNERLAATLFASPFRQRLFIPEGDPSGFLRAVAYLEDGASTEDLLVLNRDDFVEQVRVNLVELYTVVTDEAGKPVLDLGPGDFVVREEGVRQDIASFEDAGDLPLTVGLAIDSSSSMFVKLPDVQQAAGDFVRGFLSGRDRAFLVDFDAEARLAQGLTGDLDEVTRAVWSLRAGGDTALWGSVLFSLVQLQEVAGKKALVVFSDGAEEEEETPFKTTYEFARRLGVPIYLIVLHPGAAREDELSLAMRSFTRKLERLAEDTGGRVYYIPDTERLAEIYREIDEQLRSQYLITYSPSATGDQGWRKVEVEVKRRGLTARTISGYFP